MSLEDLRKRLDELRRAKAGKPRSLESIVARQIRISRAHIYVPDAAMDLVDPALFQVFLKEDKTDEHPYNMPYDCDNFALEAHARAVAWGFEKHCLNWAVGEIWTMRHALCLYARKPDARIIFWEPQTDKTAQLHSRPVMVKF